MGLDKSNAKKPEHAKTISNVRNNDERSQADRTNNSTNPNPRASANDLMDYVKPAERKKPKTPVIHTSTNDIQKEIHTMKMDNKLVKVIKEIGSEKETEIIFSGLIQKEDHDVREQIEEINGKMKR